MLKPLEGLPLQVIIRMCTDEVEVSEVRRAPPGRPLAQAPALALAHPLSVPPLRTLSPFPLSSRFLVLPRNCLQYWHNINASLDLDMRVLDDVEAEAAEVVGQNPWLTYGEALHRAREFGVCVPAIDVLEERQLTKSEIKTVAEILLAPAGSARAALPPADGPWDAFVRGVATAQDALPLVYCPVKRQQRPWIDLQELANYTPDPVRIVLERNEELLWRIYLFYSYNAAVLADARAAAGIKGATPTKGLMDRLKPMPTFRSVFRYEKRLLHQDDLWAMLNDFSLVPSVINTIRYNKIIGEFSERRNALDKVQSPPHHLSTHLPERFCVVCLPAHPLPRAPATCRPRSSCRSASSSRSCSRSATPPTRRWSRRTASCSSCR
jgi:hypothetical protein